MAGLSMDSSSYLVVSTQWFQSQAQDGLPQILPFQEEAQVKQPDLDLQAKKLLTAQQENIFLNKDSTFAFSAILVRRRDKL